MRCKQCGKDKDKVRFNICYDCERINTRRKYLQRKEKTGTILDAEVTEMDTIFDLYDMLTKAGLHPPVVRHRHTPVDTIGMVNKQIEVLESKADPTKHGLQWWLTIDLSEYTPSELYDIHDKLARHDKDHPELIAELLERFMDYDDNYTGKEV